MKNFRPSLKKLPYFLLLGIFIPLLCFSKNSPQKNEIAGHGYYMSQYEKGNIDTVIIEHAKESQTVMFGEIHDSVTEGSPPPIADSYYVISLLSELRKVGYQYLALEVNRNAPEQSHSSDILQFYADYTNGIGKSENKYAHAKPGWIELTRTAVDLGFQLRFIGASSRGMGGDFLRDKKMFENLQEEIFKKDGKAKVLIYIGANHILGSRKPQDEPASTTKTRPLGAILDDYTKGRNFTVYMGYPSDTPEDCDLFISHFIWQKK